MLKACFAVVAVIWRHIPLFGVFDVTLYSVYLTSACCHRWVYSFLLICSIRWFLSTGTEIFAKTGHRESGISLKIQLVVAPGSRDSPHVTHWEWAGNSFYGPGKNKRGTYRGVIVVSGKNRKPLMILCIPAALEIQLCFYAMNTLIAGVSCWKSSNSSLPMI